MSALARTSTIFTIAGATVITGLVAYAFYFDYRRRNDASFRKKLRKEKKRVDKDAAQATPAPLDAEALRNALNKIREEELPEGPEEKEQYFMSQVGLGEQLSTQGPMYHLPAALAFYRALRVYPQPVELLVIYQKTVPPPIFSVIMEMTNLDVSESPDLEMSIEAEQSFAVEEDETSPERTGPPSEASSQDWDKVKLRVEGELQTPVDPA
ncbi:hypothetical protein EIP86_010139 [Pleurotus ostreatoroseus]|nr:hypothetical protein EIP86_010139 [Pleurotus ostreatoroseus]